MSTDILPKFLDLRLFDIGGDDERLTRLRAAASAIAETLTAEREKIPVSVMVAMDARTPADDPVLMDVAAAVSEQWTTYLSVFSDRPVTMFRAVLLEAIRSAQIDEPGIAAAVSLTARNLMAHLDIGAEKDIVLSIVRQADDIVAPEIEREWGLPSYGPGAALPEVGKLAKLERKVLLNKISAAAGPNNEKGEALTNPNQHWPNSGEPWSHQFAQRMTVAIAESVDAISEVVATAMAKRDHAISEALSAAQPEAALRPIDRRLNLVWWRQSLFSSRADRGYRDMSPVAAAAQMAVDVFEVLPPFVPRSVEYFLKEAVAEIVGEKKARNASDSFRQLVVELIKLRSETSLDLPKSAHRDNGRRPLLSLLMDDDCGQGIVEQALGIPDATKLSLPDLAVWILRELLADAAVEDEEAVE